jgi:hypothetical protein
MNNIETFKIWSPDNALWTGWAKPVLFANEISNNFLADFTLKIPEVRWLSNFRQNTALIVDLPEEKGIEESLALAGIGYRPVPLYNGVYEKKASLMAVDVRTLVRALFAGAEALAAMNIRNDAPPVFMLDSRRMSGFKTPGTYDNRWCVFPQDMPSASFLLKQKINNVIVRTDDEVYGSTIQNDLSHILCRYQEAGIKIYHVDKNDEVKSVTVKKPSQFKSLFYRFKVISGLSRNAAGGFGSSIAEAGSGGHYYGYG